MDQIDIVQVIARWLHIIPVIVLVGGTVFARFFVMPAAEGLPDAEHAKLRDAVMSRWRYVVHACIGLILLSGFYNLIKMASKTVPTWHILVGVKILLALVVFFIASALVGRSKGLAPLRANPRRWMAITVALALVIVLMSGVLRYLPPKVPAVKPEPKATTKVDYSPIERGWVANVRMSAAM